METIFGLIGMAAMAAVGYAIDNKSKPAIDPKLCLGGKDLEAHIDRECAAAKARFKQRWGYDPDEGDPNRCEEEEDY